MAGRGVGALSVAGAGAGIWAWLGRGGSAPGPNGPYEKPTPGPSVSALKKKNWIRRGRSRNGGTYDDESPEAPSWSGSARGGGQHADLPDGPASGAQVTADIDGTCRSPGRRAPLQERQGRALRRPR
ncbi:hypothetical protein ACRAWF_25655 [Streptomyces sp. L7]